MSKKTKFIVTIEEVINQDFEVIASDFDEAIKIAKIKYNNEEFVLSPGNVTFKQISVKNKNDNSCTDWIGF